MAGLALSLAKAEQTEFSPQPGTVAYDAALKTFLLAHPEKKAGDFRPDIVSTHGLGILLPTAIVGVWGFQVPVLGTERITFMGRRFWRLLTMFSGAGESAVHGYLYAADHVLKEYQPQVGDDIAGTLWLQGTMNVYPGEEKEDVHPQ